LQRQDPGFNVSHLAELEIRVPPAAQPADAGALRQAVRALPGVLAISWGSPVGPPFSERLQVLDSTGNANVRADVRRVGPDFFETIGVSLVAGRDFKVDDLDSTTVLPIIVNESFVRQYPGSRVERSLGREFLRAGDGETGRAAQKLQVVGVARDCLARTIGDDRVPVAFLPIRQPSLIVRTASAPASATHSLQQTIERLEPAGTVVTVTPMAESLATALMPIRITTLLLATLGLIGCVLGMSGLFAVATRVAAHRKFEIAVRLAVGASRRAIVRLVLKEAILTIGIGAAAGTVCAYGLARLAQAVIATQSLADPVAFSLAVFALLALGLCASLGPALRVSHTDPAVALRSD
jgi:hypothetical protein